MVSTAVGGCKQSILISQWREINSRGNNLKAGLNLEGRKIAEKKRILGCRKYVSKVTVAGGLL